MTIEKLLQKLKKTSYTSIRWSDYSEEEREILHKREEERLKNLLPEEPPIVKQDTRSYFEVLKEWNLKGEHEFLPRIEDENGHDLNLPEQFKIDMRNAHPWNYGVSLTKKRIREDFSPLYEIDQVDKEDMLHKAHLKEYKKRKYFPGHLENWKSSKDIPVITPENIEVKRLPLKGRALPNSSVYKFTSKVPDRKKELCVELRKRGHIIDMEDIEDNGICPLRRIVVEEIDAKVKEQLNETYGKMPYTD